MVHLISYDLNKPGQNYDDVYEAIKELGSSWWHYLDSTWLVDTNLTADQISDRIKKHIDKNDYLLVIGVTSDYAGWLPEKAWEWLKNHTQYAYNY